MADEALRLNAVVIDHFTGPLQNLKNQVTNVARAPALANMRKDWGLLTKEITGGAKALQSSFLPALSGINPVTMGVAAGVTALVTAMKGMTQGAVQLGIFRRSVDITPQKYREMKLLGELFGQSAEQTQQGIRGLHSTIDQLRNTYGRAYQDLAELGLQKEAMALKGAKSISEAIEMAIDMIRREPNKHRQEEIAQALKWPGLEIIARERSQKLLDAVRAISQKTTDLSEEAALKFQLNMMVLSGSAENLTKRALAPMIPILNQILGAVTPKIETVFTQIAKEIPTIIKGLGEIKGLWDKGDYWHMFGKIDDMTKMGMGTEKKIILPGGPLNWEGNEQKRSEWIEKRLDVLAKRKERYGSLDADAEQKRLTEELKKLREFLERQQQQQPKPEGGAAALPHFQSGGVVPGPETRPRLIVAHGGEVVVPKHLSSNVIDRRKMFGGPTSVFNRRDLPSTRLLSDEKNLLNYPQGHQVIQRWRNEQDMARTIRGEIGNGQVLTPPETRINPFDNFDPFNDIPKFRDGGVVPGPEGKPQVVVAHGGETVLPVTGGGGVFEDLAGRVRERMVPNVKMNRAPPGTVINRTNRYSPVNSVDTRRTHSLLQDYVLNVYRKELRRSTPSRAMYEARDAQTFWKRHLEDSGNIPILSKPDPVLSRAWEDAIGPPSLSDRVKAGAGIGPMGYHARDGSEPGDLLRKAAAINKSPKSLDAKGMINVNLHGALRDKNAKVSMDGMFQKVNVNRGRSMPAPDAPPI